MQKGQLTQCTQQIRVVGIVTFSAKRSTPMQGNTVDAVCSGCSGIVVYGGGDIVFSAKGQTSGCSTLWMQSNQWMQWMQYAVRSGIVVYGGGDIVFGTKESNQWMHLTQYAGDTVCSGRSTYTVDTVDTVE